MAIEGLYANKPTNQNLLQSTRFLFTVPNMPFSNYWCQSVMIPSVTITPALQTAMGRADIKRAGDKLVYDPLSMQLYVDEDLRQWEEAYNWMVALTSPQGFAQYGLNSRQELYRNCTLTILNNSNIPTIRYTFYKAFPTSIGQVQLDTTAGPEMVLIFDYNIEYDYYTLDRL